MHPTKFLLGVALVFACAASGHAENRAGSLLLFPEFENSPGHQQIFTITNTHKTEPVVVEIIYISGDDCTEFNRNIELTPADTFSFLTRVHNPDHLRGYAYAFAKESTVGGPINFNHLVGSSFQITQLNQYALNPFVFEGVGAEGTTTELNGDGLRNLDGTEYSRAPDQIVIPSFFGQLPIFHSELFLIGLTGGGKFSTTVEFLVFNDNEEEFSCEYTFDCWAKVSPRNISYVFTTDFLANFGNDDPDEVYGLRGIEMGWMEIDGAVASSQATSFQDPAILAFLREGDIVLQSATLPFFRGEQANGSLLAQGQLGTH